MDLPETPLNRREYLAIAVATASVVAYIVSESPDSDPSGLSALGGEPGTYGVDGYGEGGYGE